MSQAYTEPFIVAAPRGGTITTWYYCPEPMKANQRRCVRDRVAWFRFAPGSNVIEFHRMDTDDGSTTVWQSNSVWMDPIGRTFPSLRAAFAAWS